MELTDEQKQVVSGWVAEGLGLSDIQKKLQGELGLSMTYMDVRFLILDQGLEVKDKTGPAKPATPAAGAAGDAGVGDALPARDASDPTALGGVSLELDRVMNPGCLVSGTVSFSDGVNAAWSLDQAGRLALDAGEPGYRPSEEDLQAFQEQLRAALEKRGF